MLIFGEKKSVHTKGEKELNKPNRIPPHQIDYAKEQTNYKSIA